MSQVLTIRLSDEDAARLDRFARLLGNGISRTAAGKLLIDESLREEEFGHHVEFRSSPVGRLAYLKGSSLAVWEVVQIGRGYGMDVARTASHLERPEEWVRTAFDYAAAYPREIDALLELSGQGVERLRRLFPGLDRFAVAPAETDPA